MIDLRLSFFIYLKWKSSFQVFNKWPLFYCYRFHCAFFGMKMLNHRKKTFDCFGIDLVIIHLGRHSVIKWLRNNHLEVNFLLAQTKRFLFYVQYYHFLSLMLVRLIQHQGQDYDHLYTSDQTYRDWCLYLADSLEVKSCFWDWPLS